MKSSYLKLNLYGIKNSKVYLGVKLNLCRINKD
jgi:hypothetical protein